jgi:hypothetical protein
LRRSEPCYPLRSPPCRDLIQCNSTDLQLVILASISKKPIGYRRLALSEEHFNK